MIRQNEIFRLLILSVSVAKCVVSRVFQIPHYDLFVIYIVKQKQKNIVQNERQRNVQLKFVHTSHITSICFIFNFLVSQFVIKFLANYDYLHARRPTHTQADIHDHLSQRRSSYNIEYGRNRGGTSGSASKVDLLKSALEINHKSSNSSVMSKERTSNPSLNRFRADSAPKLNFGTSKTLIIPTAPVLEVIVMPISIFSENKSSVTNKWHRLSMQIHTILLPKLTQF